MFKILKWPSANRVHSSISLIALREIGYSGVDVARYLGVTNSWATRFVASVKNPDVDDLNKKVVNALHERTLSLFIQSFQDADAWDLAFWQSQALQQRLSALVAIRKYIAKVRKARRSSSPNGFED